MEIQKYQPITAHILGHAKVEKLPEKQDLSKNAKRTYNVTMPQPILVNIQIESKNKHSKTSQCHQRRDIEVSYECKLSGAFHDAKDSSNFSWK